MKVHFQPKVDGMAACKNLGTLEMARRICKGCSRPASDWLPPINLDIVFQVQPSLSLSSMECGYGCKNGNKEDEGNCNGCC